MSFEEFPDFTLVNQYTGQIKNPFGEVWTIFSSLGAPRIWMPGCSLTSGEGSGIGARRTIAVDIENWSIRYNISRDDVPGVVSFGTFFLETIEPKVTEMTLLGESSSEGREEIAQLQGWLDLTYTGF
ncbi:hypothetical protein Slin15195_G073020 [Septoria linicola]|uniref:Uncharacterized protein n=1 Tax=Septoria linicola TaxID=215465 RepID=A0A9Q9AXP0_9PEZI|nr:hypothetical protein Slin15195_G073020 [Septoria linicola]